MLNGTNDSYKKVAEFILNKKEETIFMTLDTIAIGVGVSTTTILRFARKLGFVGYKDFQTQLRNEMVAAVSVFSPYSKLSKNNHSSDKESLLSRTTKCAVDNINNTMQNVNLKSIKKTMELFGQAKGNVYFCGLGSSFSMAYLAYTRFVGLRKDIFLYHQDIAEAMDPVIFMNNNDVCFFFIFHRYNKRSVQLLKEMFSRGVKMVIITDYPCEDIALYGEIVIPICADSTAPKISLVAAVCLIDYLCAALTSKNREETLEKYAAITKVHSKYNVVEE